VTPPDLRQEEIESAHRLVTRPEASHGVAATATPSATTIHAAADAVVAADADAGPGQQNTPAGADDSDRGGADDSDRGGAEGSAAPELGSGGGGAAAALKCAGTIDGDGAWASGSAGRADARGDPEGGGRPVRMVDAGEGREEEGDELAWLDPEPVPALCGVSEVHCYIYIYI
jgi:hypothetical protein